MAARLLTEFVHHDAARLGVAAACLLAIAALLGSGAGCAPSTPPSGEPVEIGGEVWTFELSRDEPTRRRGLGGRASLPERGGMMFIFPDVAIRSFWMYDCLMPIDVVFLDPLGVITAVHEMPIEPARSAQESESEYSARLPLYSSRFPAQFALEFPAGTIDRLGLRPNTKIDLDVGRLKRLAR